MTDLTFDLFMDTLATSKALPLAHGVYQNFGSDYAKEFCTWVLTDAKFFRQAWAEKYGSCDYADLTYIGDAWVNHMDWSFFSDYYKDCFGCRPHLDRDLYASALGFACESDTLRIWSNLTTTHYYELSKTVRGEMQKQFEGRGY